MGNEKKGFFGSLIGNKAKKGSCCGGFELEEIPDANKDSKNVKKGSCCGGFELEEIPDDSETNKEK